MSFEKKVLESTVTTMPHCTSPYQNIIKHRMPKCGYTTEKEAKKKIALSLPSRKKNYEVFSFPKH